MLDVERAVRESRRGRRFRQPNPLDVVEAEALPGEKRVEDVFGERERRGGEARVLEVIGAVVVPGLEKAGADDEGRRDARPDLVVALVGDDPERRSPGDGVELRGLEHPRPDVDLAPEERGRHLVGTGQVDELDVEPLVAEVTLGARDGERGEREVTAVESP